MEILLTEKEKYQIEESFPELNCSLSRKEIWGTLKFNRGYDECNEELIHTNEYNNLIKDSYEIRIDFKQNDTFKFPKVFEESGKIAGLAKKYGISVFELHCNADVNNSCCLGVFPEYQWKGTVSYINEKIIPFFYWQSHKRIFNKEPWSGRSHGRDGIFEAMTLKPREIRKGKNRNRLCPCESGKKYKRCCKTKDELLIQVIKDNYSK